MIDLKSDKMYDDDRWYRCHGCYFGVKGKDLVEFEAFGVTMCVCSKCSEALKNLTEALERRNGK